MSSKRRSGYESIDESADDTELEEMSKDGDTADEKQSGCCARFRTSLAYFFTDWPWETVEYISVPKAAATAEKKLRQDDRRSSSSKVIIGCMFCHSVIAIIARHNWNRCSIHDLLSPRSHQHRSNADPKHHYKAPGLQYEK